MERPVEIDRLAAYVFIFILVVSVASVVGGGVTIKGALRVAVLVVYMAVVLVGVARHAPWSRDALAVLLVAGLLEQFFREAYFSCIIGALVLLPDIRRLYVRPQCFEWFQKPKA